MRALTLLSGANASGKSAIMQALVLLHQTMCEHEWSLQLMLNGAAVRLGTASDVVDQVHGRRECGIELLDDDKSYSWSFVGEREDMAMQVASVCIDGMEASNPAPLQNLLPHPHGSGSFAQRIQELTYLKAERLGPRDTYPLESPQGARVVGPRGEHVVSVLHANRDSVLIDDLVIPGVPPTLLRQVEARMAHFFPGFGITVEQVPRTNVATLGLRTSTSMDFHRPIHTGFGLTQVLPIIVAALSAEIDALLLIENPEVHLHPAGQAAMGEFLSEVASVGVQVIIETHSDHVLNGIRRSVKSGVLSNDNVVLHFFRPRDVRRVEGESQVQTPALDADGNIDTWPDGFFDQFDNDMNYFAGWH